MTAAGDTTAAKSEEMPRSDGDGRPAQVISDMQIPGQLLHSHRFHTALHKRQPRGLQPVSSAQILVHTVAYGKALEAPCQYGSVWSRMDARSRARKTGNLR